MKHAKRIGALICIIAICFTLMCAPSAHAVGALGGQAAGAWVAAGLVALNIVADVAIGTIGNYFGWQAHPTNTTLLQQDLQYTFPVASEYISNYMNAATIKVDQGVTIIDGVEYDELFVSPGTFTNGLKTNLFDFKSKWNILSGQSGIELATGAGYANGVPIFNSGGNLISQTFSFDNNSGNIGNFSFEIQKNPSGNGYRWHAVNNATGVTRDSSYTYKSPFLCRLKPRSSTSVLIDIGSGLYNGNFPSGSIDMPAAYVEDPFEYTYVSGIVPAEESDIPSDYGISLKIPHDQLQTFYNTYPQYNIDNSVINIEQDQIDIDALTQAIFDQITSMDQVKAEWKSEDEPVPPEPGPPEPVPPEPAEDVLEGINTISEQQFESNQIQYQDYVIQQQQLQQQQQQLQQQQQINQNTQSIKDSIDQLTDTPTSEDLPDFKFDLRELFPFCIPFDIYRLLSSFDSTPQAPHVQLPIVIQSIGFRYTLDLDFSSWDPVAQAMRTAELIVYAIGLAWATGKVIKW